MNDMNRDMTFIISKNLIDFIRKYQHLNNLSEELNQVDEHAPKKATTQEEIDFNMKSLMNDEVILKIYNLFVENLI